MFSRKLEVRAHSFDVCNLRFLVKPHNTRILRSFQSNTHSWRELLPSLVTASAFRRLFLPPRVHARSGSFSTLRGKKLSVTHLSMRDKHTHSWLYFPNSAPPRCEKTHSCVRLSLFTSVPQITIVMQSRNVVLTTTKIHESYMLGLVLYSWRC